jgi:hypothetical protein
MKTSTPSLQESCKLCYGKGVLQLPPKPRQPPTFQKCKCTLLEDTLTNIERGWRGLSKVKSLKSSLLQERETKDLWITSRTEDFRANLKTLAALKGPLWNFKVVSDADLMVAWLANIAAKSEVYDADYHTRVSQEYLTVVDLVEPPDLLIIQLGVKAARNQAMPEVLLEALAHRAHLGKPTWVSDQYNYPLGIGHIAWSQGVIEFLSDWEHLKIPESAKDPVASAIGEMSFQPEAVVEGLETRIAAPSIASGSNSSFKTKTVELNLSPREQKPKKTRRFSGEG